MLWDAGVLASLAICAGIAIDLLGRPVLPTTRCVGAIALSGVLWTAGDLLLRYADGPEQVLLARRILFAGVCSIGPLMLCTALRMQIRDRERLLRGLLFAGGLFEAATWGLLFTGHSDLFIAGAPNDPARGPLFPIHAALQWCLCLTAIALFVSSTADMRGASRLRGALVAAGASFPVGVNLGYVVFGAPDLDPTPIAMGVGALALRWGAPYMVGLPYLVAQLRSELLDQIEAGVFVADGRGRVLETNRGARSLLPSMDPVGAYLGDLLAPFAQDPAYDVRTFPLERHGRPVGVGAIVNDRQDARIS